MHLDSAIHAKGLCFARLFTNAVLFVLKTGIPWEDLPERYGKPNTVWKRFDRWYMKGVWEHVFRALGEDDLEEELAEVHLDSSSIKAHQTASTGKSANIATRLNASLDAWNDARRVATRYEKKAANFAGFLWLAALINRYDLNVRTT